MTQKIDSLQAIASDYDVIVFDQWGVLHDGSAPYPGAVDALERLNVTKAVLSNSGKRAAPNADRIARMGFPKTLFDHVMTSGEALWQDVARGEIDATRFHAVERAAGDAASWAQGLEIELVPDMSEAEAILLMGLPDGARLESWLHVLELWNRRGLPVYCSNPDRQSPRADGLVISPGALAHAYKDMGGETAFYGKPHWPVFQALKAVFGPGRYLMIGDSMEHDIAGAHRAGWDSLLVESGLYADRFRNAEGDTLVARLAVEIACPPPTYRIEGVR